MVECNCSTAFSERYSLKKPRPTERPTMTRMMSADVRSPTRIETAAAPPAG